MQRVAGVDSHKNEMDDEIAGHGPHNQQETVFKNNF